MAGDEAVEVVAFQAEAGKVVPASHVFSWGGQAGYLAEDLEQAIVVEVQESGVVLFELASHGTIEQLHISVGKSGEWSVDGDRAAVWRGRICGSPGGNHASRAGGGSGYSGGLKKSSAADTAGHGCLLRIV